MALNRYLVNGDTKDFYYISNRNAPSLKFVIALDDDNVMLPGTAKELVNLISHPSNSRYDLISVRSKYNLYSVKTPIPNAFLPKAEWRRTLITVPCISICLRKISFAAREYTA